MTIIYAFTYKPEYEGLLKIGQTIRSVNERLKSNILMPSEPYIELSIECGNISDSAIHEELKRMGKKRVRGEWFECTKKDVIRAILSAKGIQVQNEGDCKTEELIKYIDKNHRNLESLEGVTNLSEIMCALNHCRLLGIVSVDDLKNTIDLWYKIKNNQNLKVIHAIRSYGIEKLLKYYETIFNKIEKVSNFDIEKVLANKSNINSFLKLYNICGEHTLSVLEKVNILEELLKECNSSPIFSKALLRNLKVICDEADNMRISEKECIKLMEETVKEVNKMKKELDCYTLSDLRVHIDEYEEYMASKGEIDSAIVKVKELWKQWEVKNVREFWEIAKRVDKEQKSCKMNFIKAIVGEDNDPSIAEDLEEKVFEFGKYRGKKIKQVIYEDGPYIRWLIDSFIEKIQIISILSEQVRKEKQEKKEQKKLQKKSLEDVKVALKEVFD